MHGCIFSQDPASLWSLVVWRFDFIVCLYWFQTKTDNTLFRWNGQMFRMHTTIHMFNCPNLAIWHKTIQILAEFKQCLCKLHASSSLTHKAFILHLYSYCKLRMVPGYPAENSSKCVPHILTYYPSAGSLVIILFSSHKLSHAKKWNEIKEKRNNLCYAASKI